MEKAKVYYSDLRTSPTSNLLDKMERLLKRAGIEQLPLKDSFAAIKIHFGEPGNLAYLRPNYAARMATLLRSLGAKPFLTDCNTLYSGRRANAVDHLQSAMENGFNPISAQCQVIIGDGLKGTDYREIPLNGDAYAGKYLLEASFRSDASSKFAPGHRNSFFPSGSVAWRISEEPFFESLKNAVNSLKIRASYGSLGNTVGGNYDWQALYKKVNNVFDEKVQNGLIQSSIQNLALSWEKVTTYNFGLDASFLNQRLTLEADFYLRKTSDILTNSIIYKTMGSISAPMSNTASLTNHGFEFNVGWNDQINDFRYGIGINMAFNKNKVTDFKGALQYELDENTKDIWGNPTWRYTNLADVSTGGDTRRVEGHMIDEYFLRRPYKGDGSYKLADGSVNPKGGPRDGMIRTKADLDWVAAMMAAGYTFNNNLKNIGSNGSNLWYGDLIMDDVNGDGKYGNDDDREFTGKSSTPKVTLGLNITAAWRGFDLNMTWSGRFGGYHYLNSKGANGSMITNVGDALPGDAWDKFYFYDSEASHAGIIKDENGTIIGSSYDPATDPNANISNEYPRLLTSGGTTPSNTFYLYNTSFFKLKSLQIGYTLPKKWIAPTKISNLRVFVSGENLLTIKSSRFPGVDPELGRSLAKYPIARMFSGGLSVTF